MRDKDGREWEMSFSVYFVAMGIVALLAALAPTVQGCSALRRTEFQQGIDEMVAAAKTPADHEAIASAYEEEAASNRDEAATHLKIAESYDRRPHWRFDYSKLCRQMAQDYADLAKEDSELAQEHRKMADSMRAAALGGKSP